MMGEQITLIDIPSQVVPTLLIVTGVWDTTRLNALLVEMEISVREGLAQPDPSCSEVAGYWFYRLLECKDAAGGL